MTRPHDATSGDVVESQQGALFSDPSNRETRRRGLVASRFVLPPFTVFDARGGEWLTRKRAWTSLGIKGEEGRDSDGFRNWNDWATSPCQTEARRLMALRGEKASAFDPVLCEIAYRWFCPLGGQVVDPFAGGSVRGIVATCLGLKHWGSELRRKQVDANEEQAEAIVPEARPTWVCGDSTDTLESSPAADFVFSCPPYGDLERYSDDPRDLSSLEWHAFVTAYKRIILRSVGRLADDRFACFVVGNFRDPKGFYRDLVGETVRGFESVGARFYNEAVLVTPVGSASLRVSKQFRSSRKLCKCHQNVLVFVKGDAKRAALACRRPGEDASADHATCETDTEED